MIDIEKAIIGKLLANTKEIETIYKDLQPEMFETEILGRMYYLIRQGYDTHEEVDLVTIRTKLADKFPQDLIMSAIKACMTAEVGSGSIKTYSDSLVSAYKSRRLNKFLNSIEITPMNVKEQIRAITQVCENIESGKSNRSHSMAEIVKAHKDSYFTGVKPDRLNMGFETLDNALGGVERGDVVVIGARPAVGKSALATQIATSFVNQGKRVGYYNLEMLERQVYERFVTNLSKISIKRLRSGEKANEEERRRFNKANEILSQQTNLVVTTGGGKTVSEIRAEVRHMDYDVLIVDYLQLVLSDNQYRGNRVAEVGAISKAFKSLAMELNITIVLLSQLRRPMGEEKETKEPTMADLRESGDIEQDASVILLLWNTDKNDKKKKGIKIEKNRQGELMKEALEFDGEHMQFKEAGELENSTAMPKAKGSRNKSNDLESPFHSSTSGLPFA